MPDVMGGKDKWSVALNVSALDAKEVNARAPLVSLPESATPRPNQRLANKRGPDWKRTIITFGTYDLCHLGHLELLRRCAALGDRVIVGKLWDFEPLLCCRPYAPSAEVGF